MPIGRGSLRYPALSPGVKRRRTPALAKAEFMTAIWVAMLSSLMSPEYTSPGFRTLTVRYTLMVIGSDRPARRGVRESAHVRMQRSQGHGLLECHGSVMCLEGSHRSLSCVKTRLQ